MEFDPAANVCAGKADFGGTAPYNALAFAIGTKGYVGTGYDGNYLKDESTIPQLINGCKKPVLLVPNEPKRTYLSIITKPMVGWPNNDTFLNDFWVCKRAATSVIAYKL